MTPGLPSIHTHANKILLSNKGPCVCCRGTSAPSPDFYPPRGRAQMTTHSALRPQHKEQREADRSTQSTPEHTSVPALFLEGQDTPAQPQPSFCPCPLPKVILDGVDLYPQNMGFICIYLQPTLNVRLKTIGKENYSLNIHTHILLTRN